MILFVDVLKFSVGILDDEANKVVLDSVRENDV